MSNNFARFATVSSVNSMVARLSGCLCVESLFIITFMFMTFQHLPSASNFTSTNCLSREKEECLSTFERVFPTKIDADSRFTCQAALHLWFRIFHLCKRTLKFVHVCITTSFGTVFPRTVVAHTSVFHESDDVSFFVTKCPANQKSGMSVIIDFATNKNEFQKSNNIAPCFVSCVCVILRDFFVPPSLSSPHHSLQGSSESIRYVSLPTATE